MSVGRNNYLVICCQSSKSIFFLVHLEGTSLSSLFLLSFWSCFLSCALGFFVMHMQKYWFSPEARIPKQSLCCPLRSVDLQRCVISTARPRLWTVQNLPVRLHEKGWGIIRGVGFVYHVTLLGCQNSVRKKPYLEFINCSALLASMLAINHCRD